MTATATDQKTGWIRLVCVALEDNRVKWWEGWCEGADMVTKWGRIGEPGQTTRKSFASPAQAEKALASKEREKIRHEYTPQRTVAPDGTVQASAAPAGGVAAVARQQVEHGGDAETAALIDFLSVRNVHALVGATGIRLEAGALTTPLGPVTPEGADEAVALLDLIGRSVVSGRPDPRFPGLVNSYLRIVPRAMGRGRTEPSAVFPDAASVTREVDTVEALRQAVADASRLAAGSAPRVFDTRLTPVPGGSDEFRRVRKLFESTLNARHTTANKRLVRVWEAAVRPADEAFEATGRAVGNLRELWHGSSDCNILSVLKTGYVLPRRGLSARITGAMFGGPGVYFSEQSTKSLGYSSGFWSGGGDRGSRCFMFLNHVALGREYHPTHSFSGLPPAGYDSTYVRGGTAGVRNNEVVVYKTCQARPILLAEFV